jgi:hypothetical protein
VRGAREAAADVAVVGDEMHDVRVEARMNGRNTIRAMRYLARLLFVTLLGVLVVSAARAAPPKQHSFATPDDAASALVQAIKVRDRNALLATLGDAGDWLSSGDAVADKSIVARFISEYEEKHTIVPDGDKATLTIGSDDFPFAFPLVKSGTRWRFDTVAGKKELLARRIGGNELAAINVLRAVVDAEQEYASEDRAGDGVLAYAQRLASRPGKRDGLYWATKAGEPESPLGLLMAQAAREGYKRSDKAPTPYHGYFYRMLKGQGRKAESGAFDYVVRGRGIASFAVVAYPARYRNSGIMTFIVNQDGKIYQKDLGPQTNAKASGMERFNPDEGWSSVDVK